VVDVQVNLEAMEEVERYHIIKVKCNQTKEIITPVIIRTLKFMTTVVMNIEENTGEEEVEE